MLPTVNHLITGLLWYLLGGSLTWWAMWCRDVVQEVQVRRLPAALSVVIASVWVILLWPFVVYAIGLVAVKGVRR